LPRPTRPDGRARSWHRSDSLRHLARARAPRTTAPARPTATIARTLCRPTPTDHRRWAGRAMVRPSEGSTASPRPLADEASGAVPLFSSALAAAARSSPIARPSAGPIVPSRRMEHTSRPMERGLKTVPSTTSPDFYGGTRSRISPRQPRHSNGATRRWTTRLRIAGSVGRGVASLRRRFIFGETQRLKERESDHREERVMMEAPPGSTLEVIEPKFLLHLLMALLACPPSLYRCHDRFA